jgi:flagellar assembly protein FliH
MSSCVIRKEEQPACLPWEMASFDPVSLSATNSDYDNISLPTVERITAIHDQARQEGYGIGHAEGLAEGRAEAAIETARLHGLADTFAAEICKADEAISQQVLDLSLDLARALLKSALIVRPELVIPIVKEAVRYLPTLHQPALLYLNPGDAVLIQNKIGDELGKLGWQLTEDTQLEAGGCRVETAHNQIDASLPTRWKRLAAALGKDADWLAA